MYGSDFAKSIKLRVLSKSMASKCDVSFEQYYSNTVTQFTVAKLYIVTYVHCIYSDTDCVRADHYACSLYC